MSTLAAPRRAGRSPLRSAGSALARAGLLTPGLVLLVLFAFLPLVALVVTGFLNDASQVTAANFTHALTSGTYMGLLGRTLLISFAVTVVSIALGWPAAWALARHVRPSRRSLILGLVIIPYITSQLLLIYGLLTLIQAGGPLSFLLTHVHMADAQASFLYTPWATVLMLIYESLPTAILVMYSASESIDASVLEAARTLGARPGYVLRRVIWPLSSSMVVVNFTLTFVQTVGAFAEPAILGGPGGQMLGNAIQSQLSSGAGPGFAVALSLLLLASSLVIVGGVALLVLWRQRADAGGDTAPVRRTLGAHTARQSGTTQPSPVKGG
jgi:ABC-type spermidine/putrescine transport system permease subunit I